MLLSIHRCMDIDKWVSDKRGPREHGDSSSEWTLHYLLWTNSLLSHHRLKWRELALVGSVATLPDQWWSPVAQASLYNIDTTLILSSDSFLIIYYKLCMYLVMYNQSSIYSPSVSKDNIYCTAAVQGYAKLKILLLQLSYCVLWQYTPMKAIYWCVQLNYIAASAHCLYTAAGMLTSP